MRQRMALIGFSYLCASVAAVYFGANTAKFVGIALAAVFAVLMLIPSVRRARVFPIAAFFAAAAMLMYSYYYTVEIEPLKALDGEEINITARVCDLPYDTDNGTVYTLKVLSHDNPLQCDGFNIRVKKTYAADVSVYGTVTCRVKLYFPEGGGFSNESYMLSRGIVFTGYIKDVYSSHSVRDEDKMVGYYILKLRESVSESIDMLLNSRSAQITRALLLGDKNAVDSKLKSQLSAIGASHLIVVSGLHMSMAAFFALLVFGMIFRKNKKISLIFAVLSVIVFMALTGFTKTVMRSGTVIILSLIGQLIGARTYKFSSMGFAALLILLLNPMAAGDIGVILSFTASLGIMIFTQPIVRAMNNRILAVKGLSAFKPVRAVIRIITASLGTTAGATMISLPIMIIVFKRISIATLVSNILLIPAVEAVLFFIMTALILYIIPFIGFTAYPFALPVRLLCDYIRKTAEIISSVPYIYVNTSRRYIALWLALSMILAAITIMRRRGFKFALKTALASILILLVGISSDYVLSFDRVYLNIIDAGDGYAAVLNYNGNTAVIACCEDNRFAEEIADYISVYTRNVSLVEVASDSAADKYMCNLLLSGYRVENVMSDKDNIAAIKSLYTADTCTFTAVENKEHTVLWGCIRLDTFNRDGRLCTYIEYYGKSFLLLPNGADINGLDERLLSADICVTGKELAGSERLKSQTVITGGKLEEAIDGTRRFFDENRQVLLLCRNGCIVFEMDREKTPIIRRDTDWR